MGMLKARWVARAVVATMLLATVAACGGSSATPHGTAPASAATASPTASPTPEITPETTPPPAPPPAPAEIHWSVPCQEDMSCTGYGEDPFAVTWTPVDGPVDGYVLYYTPGTYDPCAPTWTATGEAAKIASVDATTTSWTGTVPSTNGKFSVVAFNVGGLSAATMSDAVFYMDYICPED